MCVSGHCLSVSGQYLSVSGHYLYINNHSLCVNGCYRCVNGDSLCVIGHRHMYFSAIGVIQLMKCIWPSLMSGKDAVRAQYQDKI